MKLEIILELNGKNSVHNKLQKYMKDHAKTQMGLMHSLALTVMEFLSLDDSDEITITRCKICEKPENQENISENDQK